ncbi:MAG: hypothetical protein R3E10_11565 [Gemmatimonadota bacterium]
MSGPEEAVAGRAEGAGRDSLRLNQLFGLVIVLVAIGAIVWLTVVARARCSDADLPFVAYVSGIVELRADTRVQFYEQCVGRIAAVEPGLAALQVSVERPGPLGERQSLTLSARDPVAEVGSGALTLRYQSPESVVLEGGEERWELRRSGEGVWAVDGPGRAEGVPSGEVRPGTALTFGPVRLQWSDVGRYTRIQGFVDASAFAQVSAAAGLSPEVSRLDAALGVGTAVAVGSSIGIGTSGPPRVRLVPSYSSTQLVAEREGVREFSPQEGADVLAFLSDAMDYLSSPAKADAPPQNRYERIIDDLNGSLAEMRGAVLGARRLADTLGAVADRGGDQLAGRLILGQRQLETLESALTHIDSVLTTVESSVSANPDAPLGAALFLNQEQAESVDRTIANVRALSDELRDGSKTVFTRIAGDRHGVRFDSIVVRTERLSERANEMLDQLEESGGSAARGAKIYGVVTALAQALSTIAVLGIWR